MKYNESRIRDAYAAYVRLGTLQLAGDELGITRERVRQLINRGVELEFFENPIRPREAATRNELLDAIVRAGTPGEAARDLKIGLAAFRRLMLSTGIDQTETQAAMSAYRKQQCWREYSAIVESLGRHPTVTDLEFKIPGARALYARIARIWGSFAAFRREMGIPAPKQGNPNFRSDVQKGQDNRHFLAFLKREQVSREVVAFVQEHEGASAAQLLEAVPFGEATLYKLLKRLIARGVLVPSMKDGKRIYISEKD